MSDRILSAETIHEGWMSLKSLDLELGGERCRRSLLLHPSGSTVLAYDPGRKVAMCLRQTRLAVLAKGTERLLEAIAGVTEDEPPAVTAQREALEETGIRLGSVEFVARVWMTPSSTTERVHLFLGTYSLADRIGRGGGADTENEVIDAEEHPLAELWIRAVGGEMMDAKLFMLLQALHIRRPDLF